MRYLSILCLFILLSAIFSCEKMALFFKCNDCSGSEPVNTNLDIKVDNPYHGSSVLIRVYEGNLEDSVLYSINYTSNTRLTVPVSVNKKYTVTATYYIPDDYYIAVDSAIPRVQYNKDQCENPCYFVYDKIINLRLKYY